MTKIAFIEAGSLGFTREWALGSLRLTMGMYTTPAEIDSFLKVLPDVVLRLRKIS